MTERLAELLRLWREEGVYPQYKQLAALLEDAEVSPAPHEPNEAQ